MSYLFVDGAYLREVVARWCEEWYGERANFNPNAVAGDHDKVFYYDAGPPAGMSPESGGGTQPSSADLEALFQKLRAKDGWHVALGDSKRRGKGQGKQVQQKEVDVLLTVDMLTHAHRRNASAFSLLAGDLDFRPLLEAVVREGVYVTLICETRSASEELGHAADAVRPLDFNALTRIVDPDFFNRHDRVSFQYQANTGVSSLHRPVKNGYVDGKLVATLYRSSNPNLDSFVYSNGPVSPDRQWARVSGRDESLLCRVYEHHISVTTWIATSEGPPS